jgi:hypothetical protein
MLRIENARRILLSGFVAALLLTFTTSSHAANWMSAHGSSCQPFYPSESTPNLYRSTYGIKNAGTATATVMCPITRGNGASTSGGAMTLYYNRGTSSSPMYCASYSVDVYGNTYGSSPGYSVYTSGFGVYPFNHVASVSAGSYFVFCTLAPGDSVTSIFLSE